MSSLTGLSGSGTQPQQVEDAYLSPLRRRLDALGFAEEQAKKNLNQRAGATGGSLYDPSYGAAEQDIVEARQRGMQEAFRDFQPASGGGGGGGGGGGYTPSPAARERLAPVGAYQLPNGSYTNDVQLAIAARKLAENGPDRSAEGLLARQQAASADPNILAKFQENADTAVGGSRDRYAPAPTMTGAGGPAGARYGMPTAADQRTAPTVKGFGSTGTGYYDGSGIQLGVPGQGGWSGGKSGNGASPMGIQTGSDYQKRAMAANQQAIDRETERTVAANHAYNMKDSKYAAQFNAAQAARAQQEADQRNAMMRQSAALQAFNNLFGAFGR